MMVEQGDRCKTPVMRWGKTLGSPPALVDCTAGGCKVLTVYKTHVSMYEKKKQKRKQESGARAINPASLFAPNCFKMDRWVLEEAVVHEHW